MNPRIALLAPLLAPSIVTAVVALSPISQRAPSIGVPTVNGAVAGNRKLALLIGINNYKYPDAVPTLFGALNDVDEMSKVLKGYGFREADIHTLRNEEATRQRILSEIDSHLIGTAKSGDVVVFYFSGHGSQMDDASDPTGRDNTIVPHDSRDVGRTVKDITDKELNARVRRIAAAVGERGAVTIVLDSCNSGTGVRGATVRSAPKDTRWGNRPPPPDLAGVAVIEAADPRKSGYGDSSLRYALIAGSLSQQLSYERVDSDGRTMGALTYFLVQELRKLPQKKRSYRDVMEVVTAHVNREFRNQLPQLEGLDRDRVVFGDETIESRQYLLARFRNAEHVVEIEGGSLHSVTVGSEFDLYGSEARTFVPPETPLAKLVIDRVDPLKSQGTISIGLTLPDVMRAVERKHAFPDVRTAVFYQDDARSAALRRIKAKLEADRLSPFQTVPEGREFTFRLVEEGGHVQIFGRDGEALSSAVSSTDESLVEKMETRLLTWDRWFSILALGNPSSPVKLDVQVIPVGASEPIARDALPSFTPGSDRFELQVSADYPGRVYLYILDITSTGKVQQVYPDPGENVPIERGQVWHQSGGTSLPAGRTFVRDVFKIIGTSEPTNLAFLQLETPRGDGVRSPPPSDPLGRLLFRAAMGVRGDIVTPTTWSAVDVVFDVCAKIEAPLGRCRRE